MIEKNINLLLIISMIVWGISWPLSKVMTFYSDTYTLLFLKFFFSTLSLIPVLIFFVKKITFSKVIIGFLAAGTFTLVLYNFLFFLGVKYGYAGLGGVLVTTSNPLITLIIMAYIDKVKITKIKKLALLLGAIGGVIMLELWKEDINDLVKSGNLFFLLSSFTWSALTIINSKVKNLMGSLQFTFYIYLLSTFTSFFFTSWENISYTFEYDSYFWLSLIFTTFISSGFATGMYFKASTLIGASNASSFIFLVPAVALLSSSFLLDEPLHITTIIGGILSIIAIYLLNKKK